MILLCLEHKSLCYDKKNLNMESFVSGLFEDSFGKTIFTKTSDLFLML